MEAYESKWLGEDRTSSQASLASIVLVDNIVVVEHTVVGTDSVADPYSDLWVWQRVIDKDWVPWRPPVGTDQVG